jgi:hypothetical protein
MKANYFFTFLFIACLFAGKSFSQQNQVPYQLPASLNFDYEVVQTLTNNKPMPDTTEVHYFFTQSGDYAGGRFAGKKGFMQNDFVVLTKDGTAIIFNDTKKTIIIIRPRNILPDLVNLAKDFTNVNFPDSLRHKLTDKKIQTEKTGKTKLISGYTAEEYKVSDNENHTGYIWYAKVDFNTPLYYILAMAGTSSLTEAIKRMAAGNSLFQTLSDPKTLLVENDPPQIAESMVGHGSVDIRFGLRTFSILKTTTAVSTSGYTVKNYSNMGLKEILEAESQKKTN